MENKQKKQLDLQTREIVYEFCKPLYQLKPVSWRDSGTSFSLAKLCLALSYSALPGGITMLDNVCVIFIGAAFTNTQTFALSSSKHLVALRLVWFRLKIFFF